MHECDHTEQGHGLMCVSVPRMLTLHHSVARECVHLNDTALLSIQLFLRDGTNRTMTSGTFPPVVQLTFTANLCMYTTHLRAHLLTGPFPLLLTHSSV